MNERSRLLGAVLAAALAVGSPAAEARSGSAGARPAPTVAATPLPPTEAVLETAQGEIVIRLLAELAPAHVRHFVKTAKAGGYDHTTFHRIIRGGIIQGGDPLTKDPQRASQYGTGGLGLLKAEISERRFTRGVVAAVRRPSDLHSAGSQFFICLSDQPALDGKFSIFGEVVSGQEVADKIGETPVDADKASVRVEILKVSLREAAGAAR